MRACCWCTHYNQKPKTFTTGTKNLSGKLVKYLTFDNRCNLFQEDKYPKDCDFEEDKEKKRESRLQHEAIRKEVSFNCAML